MGDRKKLHFLAFLALLIQFPLAVSEIDYILPASLDVTNASTLLLLDFYTGSYDVVGGSSPDFTVVATNTGNSITEFQARVYIYNETGGLADNFTYLNSTIAAGETQSLSRSWNSSGMGYGNYTAYANATYGAGNYTNTVNTSFRIIRLYGNIFGNASNISATGISNLSVTINGTEAQHEEWFDGLLLVSVTGSSLPIAQFWYNFSAANLNLSGYKIDNGSLSGASYLRFSGVDQNGLVGTKTLYMHNTNPGYNAVCIKDTEGAGPGDISASCTGASEYAVLCNGVTYSGYKCTQASNNLTITGLQYSAVMQFASTSSVGPGWREEPWRNRFWPYPWPPRVIIPPAAPSLSELRVLRLSPYREVLPGENAVVAPLVENPSGLPALVSIGLAGPGESISGRADDVLIPPNERRSLSFNLRIPKDMAPGYYAFSINMSTNDSHVAYPLIIKVLPSSAGTKEAVVKRQIWLDYENSETLVGLTIVSKTKNPVSYLQVYETVPLDAGPARKISFATKPAELIDSGAGGPPPYYSAPIIRWDVSNLLPYESRTIFYHIPALLTDQSVYASWNIAQLVIIEPAGPKEIAILDIMFPSLSPGGEGNITLKVFNRGAASEEVELELLAPADFTVRPRTVSMVLAPRQTQPLSFSVRAPQFIAEGSYGFTLRLKYADKVSDSAAFVTVFKPLSERYVPPIWAQVYAWMQQRSGSIIIFLSAVAIALAAGFAVYTRLNAPHYDKERVRSLQMIERMFEDEK